MRDYIRLHSGKKFHLETPRFTRDMLPDIARNLAGINRYTGSSRFSVAQHCIVGAWMAENFYQESPYLPARFLVHDLTEFAYGDISSPLKALLPEYRALEDLAQTNLEHDFDILFVGDTDVKEVDLRMWLTERLMVYVDSDCSDDELATDYTGHLTPFELTHYEFLNYFEPWEDGAAEEIYLKEFRRLLPWVGA